MNLRLEHLKRRYGDKTVLDIDKAEIEDGKVTGIIGPNGAGKTTLLNIIAGLDTPSEGRVLYGCVDEGGTERFSEDMPKEKVTLLFQHPYIMHTTVEKNIAYPLRLRKVPKEEAAARVAELMAEMGIADLAGQRGPSLSGGEMQKVAFARALSFRPDLLLMDEPTSNIDNASSAEIERIVRQENEKGGKTFVVVSHDIAQIRRLCSEVVFMYHGRIVESGALDDVFNNPQEPETRAFIGGQLLV